MFGRLFCWLFVLTLSIEVALAIDTNAIAQKYFGNDSEWYANRIPFFESSDRNLDEIYYYRWQLFRAHQRDLGHEYGYITTEFLDNVSWQFSPWASLNDATGLYAIFMILWFELKQPVDLGNTTHVSIFQCCSRFPSKRRSLVS